MNFGKIATKGQKHIPAAAWNAMREVAQQFEDGLSSFEPTSANRNPFLITIENATGDSIEPFAVLEISDAMFPNRTGTDFLNEAINRGVELKGIKPSGNEEKNIAITLDGGPNGTLVQAVVVGAVPCMIAVSSSEEADYKYAVPVENRTDELKAVKSGNIRILWKESGAGTKWAYVLLDATADDPLKVATGLKQEQDLYPDGATLLPTDRWLYASQLDKIKARYDPTEVRVYNPLGLPSDRPVIIGKAEGFPGDAENPETGDRKIGEYVAISADTRDYFIVNGDGIYSGNNPSRTDENGPANDYFARGNVYRIAPSDYTYYADESAYDDNVNRYAVCQRDMPENWFNTFRMPYYTPETNMGVPVANLLSSGQYRCGIVPGERKMTANRLDYLYSHGRYAYDPIFTYTGEAKKTDGRLAIAINGHDYYVDTLPPASGIGLQLPCIRPDVYAGDEIAVLVDAREYVTDDRNQNKGVVVKLISSPVDFKEGMTILAKDSPGRGWTDITPQTGDYILHSTVSFQEGEGAQKTLLDSGFRQWLKNKDDAII